MATKKKKTNGRRTIYARVPEKLHAKLQKMAALRSARQNRTVTMQDTLAELIEEAPLR